MEKLRINNIPISEYGIILGNDNYKSVIQLSSLKDIQSNDWAEYDGLEVDLSAPKLANRSVTLKFHGYGEDKYESFISVLMQKSQNEFWFSELDMTFLLRVDANSLSSINGNWQTFTITFFDDYPFYNEIDYSRNEDFRPTNYTIDEIDLGAWGISVLEGTEKNLRELPSVKERLLINESSSNGSTYDIEGAVKVQKKEIQLKLLLRSDSLPTACKRYLGFLSILTQPQERLLVGSNKMSYGFYYNSNQVDNVCKLASGLYGIAFSVNISIIERLSEDMLLSTDEGIILTTDENIYLKK